MRHFGTVKSFDATTGHGSIQRGREGQLIGFQKGAVIWHRSVDPISGQRFSYEVIISEGEARAVKLRKAFERDWNA